MEKRKKKKENKYPRYWTRIRRRVVMNAGHQCFLCNKTNDSEINDIGKGLSVHHINGKKYDCERKNLLVLCEDCHIHRVHQFATEKWGKPQFPSLGMIYKKMMKSDVQEKRKLHFEMIIERNYAEMFGDPCDFLLGTC